MTKRIDWKKGGGEIVGFLCITPIIIFMLAVLITTVQLGSLKERLEYTAYKACRQAVVCKDEDDDGNYMDDAKKIAKKTAKAELKNSPETIVASSIKTKLELVQVEGEDDVKWEKGRYVKCTVSVKAKAPLAFMSGKKYASIVMMIESPANEGGDYPWFRDM